MIPKKVTCSIKKIKRIKKGSLVSTYCNNQKGTGVTLMKFGHFTQ